MTHQEAHANLSKVVDAAIGAGFGAVWNYVTTALAVW